MSIADVIAIVVGLILLGVAFPALLFLITLTFPQLVERSKEQIETRPMSNIFRGLALFIVMFIAIAIFINIPGPSKLLAMLIFLTVLSTAMIGAAGLVNLLANKYEGFSHSQKSVNNLFYSTFFLEFAAVLPFVGWFVVLPITFCLMLGTGSKTLLQRSKTQPKVSSQPQENVTTNTAKLYPTN
ncbi:MAG: hypothetical protein FD167_5710 [bacterium]|nr:MAG: hypothetical protein FD167_5710 [bacterium]